MYRCALIMDKINIFYSILRWVVSAILGWSSIAELFDWSTTCKQPKQLYCNLQRDRVRDVDRHILDVSQMSNLCIQHSPFGIYQPILVFILNKSHKWMYIFVSDQNDCEKHMSTALMYFYIPVKYWCTHNYGSSHLGASQFPPGIYIPLSLEMNKSIIFNMLVMLDCQPADSPYLTCPSADICFVFTRIHPHEHVWPSSQLNII